MKNAWSVIGKVCMKITGGTFAFMGFLGIILFLGERTAGHLFMAVFCSWIGYAMLKKPKSKEQWASRPSRDKGEKQFYFKVVGVTKKNDQGKDIQGIIKAFVIEGLVYDFEPYGGTTNKEIQDDYCNEKIYEASDVSGFSGVSLVPEPDNPYDSGAIKVVHETMGHIGYIAREDNERVAQIINNEQYEVHWEVIGGKYKYYDWSDEKVRTEPGHSYGIRIRLSYLEKDPPVNGEAAPVSDEE